MSKASIQAWLELHKRIISHSFTICTVCWKFLLEAKQFLTLCGHYLTCLKSTQDSDLNLICGCLTGAEGLKVIDSNLRWHIFETTSWTLTRPPLLWKQRLWFQKLWFHQSVMLLSHLFTAWTPGTSDLLVCGGHMFRRRGPPSPQGVPADVPQSAATQCSGWSHHIRTHGSGSRAHLRGDH